MKAIAFLLMSLIVPCSELLGQDRTPSSSQVPYEIKLAPEIAEKLLVHKESFPCPNPESMAARVSGTVVVDFDIDKNGNVVSPVAVSGPRMLRQAVLQAIRKYRYKPYLLNGKVVEVETQATVQIDTMHDCP
jgi:protein TonB